jgi:hypothetical protein
VHGRPVNLGEVGRKGVDGRLMRAPVVAIGPVAGQPPQLRSLDERVAIRSDLYAKRQWPPPGGPEQILEATPIIAWPTAFSPLT